MLHIKKYIGVFRVVYTQNHYFFFFFLAHYNARVIRLCGARIFARTSLGRVQYNTAGTRRNGRRRYTTILYSSSPQPG